MKPEQALTHIDIWILTSLQANTNWVQGMVGTPWTLHSSSSDCYPSLELAQQAQTFEALRHGRRYHIFHLEFPL